MDGNTKTWTSENGKWSIFVELETVDGNSYVSGRTEGPCQGGHGTSPIHCDFYYGPTMDWDDEVRKVPKYVRTVCESMSRDLYGKTVKS